ncbi:MAG: hypothetical protein LQ337_001695 [Flavoplaca oasis]|nr:MAG: hypothetical protein LQ337_001695 [Flavoplaca oasis]
MVPADVTNGLGKAKGVALDRSILEQRSTHVGGGWFGKRDEIDDGTNPITPDDLASYPLKIDEGVLNVNDDDLDPQFADSKNCERTDTALGTSYECSYVGDVYSEYVKGLSTPCDLS